MTTRRIAKALEQLGFKDNGNNEYSDGGKIVYIIFNRTLVLVRREQGGDFTMLMMIAARNVLDIVFDGRHVVVLHRRSL